MKVIIDADGLTGIFHNEDAHHSTALVFLERLTIDNASIFLLPTTLAEFSTVFARKINHTTAQEIVNYIMQTGFTFFDSTTDITAEAVRYYQQQTSKNESLFDCYVMAAAKKIKADCIFSFDKGYTKNGFVLIEEFLFKL